MATGRYDEDRVLIPLPPSAWKRVLAAIKFTREALEDATDDRDPTRAVELRAIGETIDGELTAAMPRRHLETTG